MSETKKYRQVRTTLKPEILKKFDGLLKIRQQPESVIVRDAIIAYINKESKRKSETPTIYAGNNNNPDIA